MQEMVPVEATLALAGSGQDCADDRALIRMWLHGRPVSTQSVYEPVAKEFLSFTGKNLRSTALADLQCFQDSLSTQAVATQCKKLSAMKSLLSFGHKTGFLSVNVGAAIFLPKVKNTLAERILSEDDVFQMIALERDHRDKTLLRLLYLAGLHASEAPALRSRDLQANAESGQITVFGKGGKTRVVLLKASIWKDLQALKLDDVDAFIFRRRIGGSPMTRQQVWRVVKSAAIRAGLSDLVSTHWMRHAHISHALDRGAPPHLVQATVGHASLATTSSYAHARPSDSSSKYLAG